MIAAAEIIQLATGMNSKIPPRTPSAIAWGNLNKSMAAEPHLSAEYWLQK